MKQFAAALSDVVQCCFPWKTAEDANRILWMTTFPFYGRVWRYAGVVEVWGKAYFEVVALRRRRALAASNRKCETQTNVEEGSERSSTKL